MHYKRLIVPGGTFFFTLVTWNRLPLFAAPAAVDTLREAIQYVLDNHPFTIDAAVVLPEHIHMLWTLPEGDRNYPTRWRLIKSRFTHLYLNERKSPLPSASRRKKGEQAIWQRRYWEHCIRDETDFSRHLEYIHYNPVHHGLVCSPGEWKYSSFHRYVKDGIYPADWGAGGDLKIEIEVGAE